MNIFRSRKMLFQLEYDNQILYSISSDQITSSIFIGRSDFCDWKLPATDRTASNRHAEIRKYKNKLWLYDAGSHNGIFLHGEKITESQISIGDHYGIGDAVLHIVEAPVVEEKNTHLHHRLEQLNGKNRKRMIELTDYEYIIGSGGGATIVCNDSMISRHHAKISVKDDGSCWICDLGSRNSTEINHMRLSPDNIEGRMLQDGDIISIVTIDFRFYDKNVNTVKTYLALKITVVILTAAILLSGYFVFRSMQPSAKSYIEDAKIFAKQRNFQHALEILHKAQNSPHFSTYQQEHQELTSRVKMWQKIEQEWESIKELILQGQLLKANVKLIPLLQTQTDIWNWNDQDAVVEKQIALSTAALLESILFVENNLSLQSAHLVQLKQRASIMDTLSKKKLQKQIPHINLLKQRFENIREELNFVIQSEDNIEAIVNSLTPDSSLPDTVGKISGIRKHIQNHIAQRRKARKFVMYRNINLCNRYLRPLQQLNQTHLALEQKQILIAQLSFEKIPEKLEFPSLESCAIAPAFSNMRSELIRRNQLLNNTVVQIKSYINAFEKYGMNQVDHSLAALKYLHDPMFIPEVSSCKCFKKNISEWKMTRKKALDKYDEFLGIEVFWDFMTNLPETFDSSFLSDKPFTPQIYTLRQMYANWEMFYLFCQKPLSLHLISLDTPNNKLQDWALWADEVLQDRQKLVQKWMKKSRQEKNKRVALIYGGAALLLAQNPVKDYSVDSARLINLLKDLRSETDKLKNGEENPEIIISNRQKVLNIALPGDPAARQALAEIANGGEL